MSETAQMWIDKICSLICTLGLEIQDWSIRIHIYQSKNSISLMDSVQFLPKSGVVINNEYY